MSTSRTPLSDALEAQGDLQPGDPGYWRVWGAGVRDIQPGDLVLVKYADSDEHSEYEVKAYLPRGTDHPSVAQALDIARTGHLQNTLDMIRPRFLTTTGARFTIGAMQPVIVLRKGTHNMLSEYVR